MNDELKQAVQKSQAAMHEAHQTERAAFKSLLLTNPNFFGNLAESPFKPVLPISGNTHYEELVCLGYHPQNEHLVGIPSPNSGLSNTAPAPGDAWSLNTAGMQACGYVIRVVAADRAIVNSQAVGHHASDSAGFCLE